MTLPSNIIAAIRAEAARTKAGHSAARSFYFYDMTPMRAKIAKLKQVLPASVEIFYAMKANPHAAFLAAAKAAGVEGVEIASMGEGQKALDAGMRPDCLIFTGPGKSPEELEWSVTHGIRTVHVESLVEAYRLDAIAARHDVTQEVLLRVNPNFHIHDAQANFSGDSSKFGIDERKLFDDLPTLLTLKHLYFRGLHVYAASGVLKVADLLQNCELVFKMAREIEQRLPHIRCDIIDFGGGFGIDYLQTGKDFSPETYAADLQKLIAAFNFADRKFVIELGRYLAADSGWYVTEILDIKDSLGKKQIVCAGGSHHFRRPAALKINHPMSVMPMQYPRIFDGQIDVVKEQAFIGGPLCNTADKLAAHDVYIDAASIGDFIVFELAGAYGLTMSHTDFLSHARPPEIVL